MNTNNTTTTDVTPDRILYTWPGGTAQQSAGETASWQYVIDADPSTVEAYGFGLDGRRCPLANAYWVCARIPGVIVGGWLPGWKDERELGRPYEIYIQQYAYAVREHLAAGTGRWSLPTD